MSKHVIYDIGTEILCETCFVHNSTQKASPEESGGATGAVRNELLRKCVF